MLATKLEKLADVLMENETNPNIDKDIIVYGLNSAIEQGLSMITAIVLGWMFGLTLEIIVFMVSFTFIRTYAGGYHCKKAINCYLSSSGVILVVLLVTKLMPNEVLGIASLIILVASAPILYKFAPVETPTKPLDEIEKKYYHRKILVNLSFECIIILILSTLKFNTFAFVVCIGIIISAGLVMIEKTIQNK